MRRSFIIILLVGLVGLVRGQKNDYTWLTGYYSTGGGLDTACQCYLDITRFDFNYSPVVLSRDSLGINFYRTNSIISDSTGHLLFYSNGVQVRNANDAIMENGDSLGWGPGYSYLNPSLFSLGMVYAQLLLTLPNPAASNLYDLFYIYIDSINGVDVNPDKLLRARVDMNANGGLGAVVEKDILVLAQNNDITISAVRHANGRDWWLCTNQTSTNCHDIMLYTGDSITNTIQCSGEISPWGDAHACRFSPDGSIYITSNDSGQINVFNFDRCTGTLNLREEFIVPEIADSFQWWPSGLEFSPDCRFFYVFCSHRVFQYDLMANPIADSKDTVAVYHFPGHYPADYFWGQLAPDGKIYVNGGNSSYYISVIDSPNGQGNSCTFLDQSMQLLSVTNGLPYNPNYRLGALTQSQCDSLSSATQDIRDAKEQILKVFPNPANDVTTVDYGFTDWNKGPVSLQITNQLGQVVYTQALPMYSGYQRINTNSFAAGAYTACIKRNNGVVAAVKLVVVH